MADGTAINSLVRELEVLGAIRWYYHHPSRYVFPPRLGCLLTAVVSSGTFPMALFLSIAQFVPEPPFRPTLREEGLAAQARGCSDRRVLVARIQTHHGWEEVLGLPDLPVGGSWRVDGTQQFSPADQAERFTQGARWATNSCAVDCVLLIVLFLDAGRCQADQVWEGFRRQGNEAAQTVLSVVRKPWSLLVPDEIDQLRDIVREELQKLDPRSYAIGEYHSVSGVFDDLAACIPQLHATWGTVVRCCLDGAWQWKLSKKGSVQHVCVMGLVATTEQELRMQEAADAQRAVQLLLDPSFDRSPVTAQHMGRCEKCSRSPRAPERQRVLLDRPPPTLVLKRTFETTAGIGLMKGLFQDLDLSFTAWAEAGLHTLQTRYAFWGCILFQGGNHFVVCINKAARSGALDLVFYDGMRHKGAVTPIVGSLEDFVKRGRYGMNVPIYVRIS